MRIQGYFQRRALLLFFIVSLVPALVVSALWYNYTRDVSPNNSFYVLNNFLVPVVLTGIGPAMILSIIFAGLLAKPIRQIHKAINQIAKGNLAYRLHFKSHSEFAEMAHSLNDIASNLQQLLGQLEGENQLVASERNKLTVVLDTMTDGVIALDSQHRIILFNQAAANITGRTIDKLTAQPIDEAMPLRQDGKPVVWDWLKAQNGPAFERWKELEMTKSDGTKIFVGVKAITVTRDPGALKALLTFYNQSDSHVLEEMKVDFVALAAHELRTPLTNIRGYLDLLQAQAGKKLSAEQRTYLNRSIISAEQLASLVNNLLNVARIEHDELNYVFEESDWSSFCSKVLKPLEDQAKEQKRILTIKLPKNLPTVAIDVLAMTEVFTNLVDNAIQHTDAGGHITITVNHTAKEIQTSVTDDGHGIPKEALKKLFTKFYRVEGLRGGRGTGLGLFISKAIVEAHHGYMWVESKQNHGATFGFSLPPYKDVADKIDKDHNEANAILRGAHGWIKEPAQKNSDS